MLIRLDQSFTESAEKLNDRFSEQDREELSEAIEANYEKIRLIMLEQEKSKDKSKPTLLELGNIGSRFFAFSIYYNEDVDDVPISIRELIPTISPVRLDIMATTKKTKPADPNSTYLKAARVYDDDHPSSTKKIRLYLLCLYHCDVYTTYEREALEAI